MSEFLPIRDKFASAWGRGEGLNFEFVLCGRVGGAGGINRKDP